MSHRSKSPHFWLKIDITSDGRYWFQSTVPVLDLLVPNHEANHEAIQMTIWTGINGLLSYVMVVKLD